MDRTCRECGAMLVQRTNEKPGRFAGRQFCSRPCAAAAGSRVAQEKQLAQDPPAKTIERNGYLMRWVRGRKQPHGSSITANGTYLYVHRLVMEWHLGRELASNEVVHHVNGDRMDNRLENLRLYQSHSEHRTDELAERHGPKPECPVCGSPVRRGRTYCSRACYSIARAALAT